MSAEDYLYVVISNGCVSEFKICDCFDIFKDLELAKKMLKNIYNSTADLQNFDYQIRVYKFNGIKYDLSNLSYTYESNKFVKHS